METNMKTFIIDLNDDTVTTDNSAVIIESSEDKGELVVPESQSVELDVLTGFANNYKMLVNKPRINGTELVGDLTNEILGIPTKTSDLNNDSNFLTAIPEEYAKKTDIPTIPTKVSEFTNDVGYLNEIPQEYKTKVENDQLYQEKGEYLTDFTEADPTVPSYVKNITEDNIKSWNAKSDFSGNYNELSNKPDLSLLETKADASEKLTEAQTYTDTKIGELVGSAPKTLDTIYEIAKAIEDNATVVEALDKAISDKANTSDLATVATTGSYKDLKDTPAIPTVPEKVSAFANDAGYLTQVPSTYALKTDLPTKTSQLTNDSSFANINEVVSKDNVISQFDIEETYTDDKIYNANAILEFAGLIADELGMMQEDIADQLKDVDNFALKSEIPTKVSELDNDAKYLTEVPTDYTAGILKALEQAFNQVVIKEDVLKTVNTETTYNDSQIYNANAMNSVCNDFLALIDAANKAIPTKTSDLTNDSGFLTSHQDLSGYMQTSNIVKNFDSSGDFTDAQVYSANAVNELCNDIGEDVNSLWADMPTATSDLTNDSGFITKDVNNLTNYFTKEELAATLGDIEILLGGI